MSAPATRGAARQTAPRRSPARRGFALLEVVIALGVLAAALLSLASFGQRFAFGASRGAIRLSASDLATERLETARTQATYAALDTLARTELSVTGYPGFRRITVVRRTTTPALEYRTVTVLVTHPALAGDTVRKTTIVGSF